MESTNLNEVSEGIRDNSEIMEASKWLRFANLLIDYIAYMGISIVIGILVAIFFGDAGIEFIASVPDLIIGIPIFFAYYFCFEASTGKTIGKFITGTKVIDQNGNLPAIGIIVKRSLSRIIPFEAFSFLGEGRGWHDSISKTYVVKCR